MEAIVDTNVLVYETIEDSMYHEEVVNRLERIDVLYLPTNVLIEFILVMKKLGLKFEVVVDAAHPKKPWRKTGVIYVEKKKPKLVILKLIGQKLVEMKGKLRK